MDKPLNIVTANVRGLGDYAKRKLLFQKFRDYEIDVALVQETHNTSKLNKVWQTEWGCWINSYGKSNARGVAIIYNKRIKNKIEIKNVFRDTEGRLLICSMVYNDLTYTLANVYGENIDCPDLFHTAFKNVKARDDQFIIMGGDFNLVLDENKDGQNRQSSHPQTRKIILDYMEDLNLIDSWRVKNPDKTQFTWYRLQPSAVFSRLDMFITSAELITSTQSCKILPKTRSDHCPVKLSLNVENVDRGPGTWKLNYRLLSDPQLYDNINDIISSAAELHPTLTAIETWEQIKYMIIKECQRYAREKANKNKQKIKQHDNMLSQLNTLLAAEPDNVDIKNAIADIELEQQIQDQIKAESASFRSKCTWAKAGEKPTKYFLNLERKNYINKNMKAVQKGGGGSITTDQTEILHEQMAFYRKLYKSNCEVEFSLQPLEGETILKLDQKTILDLPINETEVYSALKNMKDDKTPGPDGLPKEFYVCFWTELSPYIMALYKETMAQGKLNSSARKGLITLIPKKNKDLTNLNAWRPLTMLNTDYKIIAKVIADRLNTVLPMLISEEQTGFMKGRNISENLRRTLDVITYAKRSNTPGVIMSIDFAKCFDSLEFSSIYGALRYFNFGDNFVSWSRMFFTDFSIFTQNYGHISPSFLKGRGCNQGCNISPFYYLLCGEIMLRKIKQNKEIKGIKIDTLICLISQFADDTVLYLQYDLNVLNAVIDTFNQIEKQLGLTVSYEKTVLYRVGSLANTDAKLYTTKQFKWTNEAFPLLGIDISEDQELVTKTNFNKVILKMEETALLWEQRNLTWMGKVLVINTLMESLFVYKLTVLNNMTEEQIKRIEDCIKKFLWDGKKGRVRLSTLQKDKKSGGLRLFDIRSKQAALKIGWIWKSENNILFNHLLNLQWVLPTPIFPHKWLLNIHPKHAPLVLRHYDTFWYEVCLEWLKYNFSIPQRYDEILHQYIWYNSLLMTGTGRGKSFLFNAKCIEYNIHKIEDLYSLEEGRFYTFQEFCQKYGEIITWLEYTRVLNTIPKLWKNILISSDICWDGAYSSQYETISARSKPTNYIYRSMINKSDELCVYYSRWNQEIPDFTTSVPFSLYLKSFKHLYTITGTTKYRDFQYRLLLGKIPLQTHLYDWGLAGNNLCYHCKMEPETVEHFFLTCVEIQPIWTKFKKYLRNRQFINYRCNN